MNILQSLAKILLIPLVSVLSFAGYDVSPNPIVEPIPYVEPASFGGTVDQAVAFFETTLANSITSSATTMTLSSGTDVAGTSLASSTYGFVIDEGTAAQEMVRADCTGTACTNLVRGLSPVSGTSTVVALQKAHRRGASVKITDGPVLLVVSNILAGRDGAPNPVRYESTVSTTSIAADTRNLVSVELLNQTAFSGASIVNASETVKGIIELSTQAETASGTSAGGSGARLAIPASVATTTFYSTTTSQYRVPVTGILGYLDPGFVASSTNLSVSQTLKVTGTTTLATTTSAGIQLTPEVRVYTASSTWSKPAGARFVVIKLIGGGGGGSFNVGGGGGGGAIVNTIIPASKLASSVAVTVGAGGTAGLFSGSVVPGDGASTTFNGIDAGGGKKGVGNSGAGGVGGVLFGTTDGFTGGAGATGSGVGGGGGGAGGGTGSNASGGTGGTAGTTDSDLGAGGNTATTGSLYGGGGGGGNSVSDGTAGRNGYAIITTYF